MDDLVAFLNARNAEREKLARAAMHGGQGRWHQPQHSHLSGRIEDERGEIVVYDEGRPTEAQAAHIAENDPAFVLAEVKANRRTLELIAGAEFDLEDVADRARRTDLFAVLRLRALPYADHPDYLAKWKP